jgi:hypothetical protein
MKMWLGKSGHWCSHSTAHENCCLLGYDIMQLYAASETSVHMYHTVSYSRRQMIVLYTL